MSLDNPRPPKPEVEALTQEILERSDELYEYLRKKHYPDMSRDQVLHPELATLLRARSITMAILERDFETS